MKHSKPETRSHPRDLIIIGLLFFGVGYVLSQTTVAYVFGGFALTSGLVLWGSRTLGRPRLGAYMVRGFFLIAAGYWLLMTFRMVRSDLLWGSLLSLVLGAFLYFIWSLTWGHTLKDCEEVPQATE